MLVVQPHTVHRTRALPDLMIIDGAMHVKQALFALQAITSFDRECAGIVNEAQSSPDLPLTRTAAAAYCNQPDSSRYHLLCLRLSWA